MDPSVHNINKDAVIAINKATELFLRSLASDCMDTATLSIKRGSKRTTIQVKDNHVISTIHRVERLSFLADDFPKQKIIKTDIAAEKAEDMEVVPPPIEQPVTKQKRGIELYYS